MPELAVVDASDGAIVVEGAGAVTGVGRIAHRVGAIVSVERKVEDRWGSERNMLQNGQM